jgi:hypothetical protein
MAALAAVPLAGAGVAFASTPATRATTAKGATASTRATPATTTCALGHGVKHVVEIFFDNVHFNRDNPNVPSDVEMMPHLLSFIEHYGTLLSNNHTPLIAHTADDSITTYTGLYGDRAGMPVSNAFQSYNADGTTDPGESFTYWTDPIDDTASTPNPAHDTNPSLVYAPVPPATSPTTITPDTTTPAPWVPWTRAGCNVGAVASANMELENAPYDLSEVFGPNSPEMQQYNADPDPYKDPETADYIGVAVHCAVGAAFCADAQAVKYGQTSPSPTAVSDLLPDEPGGYTGYQAVFGHRYVAPQLGAGKPNVEHNGYAVTNSAGNLVDLFGSQINGAYLTDHPGFPGFDSINAAQTLAYMADMQESGVPVTYGYISDLHGNEYIPGLNVCNNAPSALGSGSPCYVAQAQYYDAAFETFFERLAADGITPKNTEFIFSNDEGDHEAGANVGRAIKPVPADCDGATIVGENVIEDVPCRYPAGSFGELDGNIRGMLATQTGDTTPFSLENDTAPEFYVTGQPGSDTPQVRQLEHDVASLTADNPYAGATQPITNYLADPVEEGILHMVNADPARTPTFSLFAKPDYYLYAGGTSCSGSCVEQDTSYAWDHGDYAAEINNNWVAFVGPGVQNLGIDGAGPAQGPNSAGRNSGQETVPEQSANNPGPWVDETDIQPTMLFIAGLHDDYTPDGRVITQVLDKVPTALQPAPVQELSVCYKQIQSSVGDLGTDTLEADTAAIESTSTGDATYLSTDAALSELEFARDDVALQIKNELFAAEVHNRAIPPATVQAQIGLCNALLASAAELAASTTATTARSVNASVAWDVRAYSASLH